MVTGFEPGGRGFECLPACQLSRGSSSSWIGKAASRRFIDANFDASFSLLPVTGCFPIPGTALFYAGNLEPDELLTQAHFDATVRDAITRGVFRGVELHESCGMPAALPTASRRRWPRA